MRTRSPYCELGVHSPGSRSLRSLGRTTIPTSGLLLLAPGEPIEPLLHLGQLAFELVDLGARRLRLVLFGCLTLTPGEGREHRKRALEHLHVAANLILERAEGADPERLRHLLAKF